MDICKDFPVIGQADKLVFCSGHNAVIGEGYIDIFDLRVEDKQNKKHGSNQ